MRRVGGIAHEHHIVVIPGLAFRTVGKVRQTDLLASRPVTL